MLRNLVSDCDFSFRTCCVLVVDCVCQLIADCDRLSVNGCIQLAFFEDILHRRNFQSVLDDESAVIINTDNCAFIRSDFSFSNCVVNRLASSVLRQRVAVSVCCECVLPVHVFCDNLFIELVDTIHQPYSDFCRSDTESIIRVVPDLLERNFCCLRRVAVCDCQLICGIRCCVVVIQLAAVCDFSAGSCQLDNPVCDFVAVFVCRQTCECAACCPFVGCLITCQCDCLVFNLCICSVDCLIELVCYALRTYSVLVLGVIPDLLCFNIDLCRRVRYCQRLFITVIVCAVFDTVNKQVIDPLPDALVFFLQFDLDQFFINSDSEFRQVIRLVSFRCLCFFQCVYAILFEFNRHCSIFTGCECVNFFTFGIIQCEFSTCANDIACKSVCLLDDQVCRIQNFFLARSICDCVGSSVVIPCDLCCIAVYSNFFDGIDNVHAVFLLVQACPCICPSIVFVQCLFSSDTFLSNFFIVSQQLDSNRTRTCITLISLCQEFFIVPDFENSDGCFFRIIAVCDCQLVIRVACCVVFIQLAVVRNFCACSCQFHEPVSNRITVFICRQSSNCSAFCPCVDDFAFRFVECDCLAIDLCIYAVDCLVQLECDACRTDSVLVSSIFPDLCSCNFSLCRRVRDCQSALFKFRRRCSENEFIEPLPECLVFIDFNFDEFLVYSNRIRRKRFTFIAYRCYCFSQNICSFLFKSNSECTSISCLVFHWFSQISTCKYKCRSCSDDITCYAVCLLDHQFKRFNNFFRLDRCVDDFVCSFTILFYESIRNYFIDRINNLVFTMFTELRKLFKCIFPLILICIINVLYAQFMSSNRFFTAISVYIDCDFRSFIAFNRFTVNIEIRVVPCLGNRNVYCWILVCNFDCYFCRISMENSIFCIVINSNGECCRAS